MDGNGRWARERGSIRLMGHKAGVDSVRDITEACAEVGVEHLTLYAFSTENWGRPKGEVSGLMKLLVQSLRAETRKLLENNIRLTSIGETDRLPPVCSNELLRVQEETAGNTRMQLCLALSYSGRWDVTKAMQHIAEKVKAGLLEPEQITEELISRELSTGSVPDPDLIIRTGGEYRISNFLLWQSAYAEFYITRTYWPDFRRDELYEAIISFQDRERRFGKVPKSVALQEEAMTVK